MNTDGTLNTAAKTGIQWGRNTPSTGDFLKVELDAASGDPNDPNATRIFNLSLGTVRMVGRLGPSGPDPLVFLICDVLAGGQATVTFTPTNPPTP